MPSAERLKPISNSEVKEEPVNSVLEFQDPKPVHCLDDPQENKLDGLPNVEEKKPEKVEIRRNKNLFDSLRATNYNDLQKELKEISKIEGFKLSQSTGLKSGKYAYFSCFNGESNKNKEKKNKKEEHIASQEINESTE